jgi:tRNA/tmRNA/rRNA uracil-C5-methylase (TrmA/RlmC/RlmD family)
VILTVGRVAAGGACVARADDGRVVFVRHALPGERVRVVVTSETTRFLRADAVEVLEASPERVTPPCPYARPGRCGGCDWQHASPEMQLRLKTDLVREHLSRLAGHAWHGEVEPVEPRWEWRTRVQWAVDGEGRVGLHKHRSHEIQPVDRCLIAAAPPPERGPAGSTVEVTALGGQVVTSVDGRADLPGTRVEVAGRTFEVAANGFWQVHERAPEVLWAAVRDGVQPRAGESVVDLYAGAGLFSALLAEAVGPTGSVLAVEGAARAAADAARNTHDQPWVRVRTAAVTPALVRRLRAGLVDLVVLDPPRAGAGLDVTAALASLRARAIAYVSCDAATLARDLKVLLAAGWEVASLRAFDLYPQTEHVELVTVLQPPAAQVAGG